MRFLRRFFIRLSNFTTGRRADQRVREEMAEHLAFRPRKICMPACRFSSV